MKEVTRRKFVISVAALSAAPVLVGKAQAAEKVDPESTAAKALQYVHASPMEGKYCTNCQLWQGGDADEWGPCAIFPGKQVAGAGWCSAWVQK